MKKEGPARSHAGERSVVSSLRIWILRLGNVGGHHSPGRAVSMETWLRKSDSNGLKRPEVEIIETMITKKCLQEFCSQVI